MDFDYFFLFSSFVVLFCSLVYLLAYRERRPLKKEPLKKYPGMSIVVPVWNEEKTIAHTLDSMITMKEHYKGKLEIIVVDDYSTDKSFEIMSGYAKKHDFIRCFYKDKNKSRGKSESLNQGFGVASHELVGCVDADSYPDPDSLNYIAEEFADPKVGAVTTKLVVMKPKRIVEWFQHIEYIYSNFILMAFDALDSVYITRGPLSLYRKDVMEEINGFLPAHQTPTEDMEITFRIRKAGYEIRGSKKAKVYTSVMRTWKDLFWQRMRWNRGTLINFWMHRDMFFNSRFGMFSMFVLPTASLMIAMVGFIIMYMVYVTGSFFFEKAVQIYWIVSTGYYPDMYQLADYVRGGMYNNSSGHVVLFVAILVTFVLVNGFGFRESKERFSLRYIFFLALTPFVYNPIMIFFWASALVLQTTKNGVRWR